MVRYPALLLSFAQTHLCNTPFCNISRDSCAIPQKKQARKSFAILSLQVLRDMESIATGPVRGSRSRGFRKYLIGIARFLLWSAFQDVQSHSPSPLENCLKTYLVPGGKARLSGRHVWKTQKDLSNGVLCEQGKNGNAPLLSEALQN